MSLKRLLEIKEQLPEVYQNRLIEELDVINNNAIGDITPYFLLLKECVDWVKSQGYIIGPGRGSASGSLLAYLLGLTSLDPIKFKLPFKRFLSKSRLNNGTKSMADIDIDYPSEIRDKLNDYLFSKYGERAALIATFGMRKLKNSLQDAYRIKVIQPTEFIIKQLEDAEDKLKAQELKLKLELETLQFNDIRKSLGKQPIGYNDSQWLDGYTQDEVYYPGLLETNEQFKKWCAKYPEVLVTTRELLGIPRSIGQHAAGIVISDIPISDICPVLKHDGKNVIAYDKKTVQKLGLIKNDNLSLKYLDFIQGCLNSLKQKGIVLEPWDLPENPKVYQAFTDNHCRAVFQHDTPGGSALAKKLNPKNIHDLAYSVSLNRPGGLDTIIKVASGKEMSGSDAFIARRNKEEPVEYIHEDLKDILSETYGIPIFQEQVMSILQKLIGYTEEESDSIRSAISDKNPTALSEVKVKLYDMLPKKGWNNNQIEEIYQTIMAWGSYGFNCIAGDQSIKTKQGNISIQEVAENYNNYDVAYLTNDEIKYEKPSFGKKMGKKIIYEVELEDGTIIKGTPDHKFLYQGEWIDLKSLCETYSYIEVCDAKTLYKPLKIKSIKKYYDEVYDLEMPTNHNFILSNGAIAHNCSHAYGYAKIAYCSAYLKTLYPMDYWQAVLSFSTPEEIMNDYWPEIAHFVSEPNVNTSTNKYVLSDNKLIPPLNLIEGVGDKAIETISANAPYSSLEDFLERSGKAINKKTVINLIKGNALNQFFIHEKTLEQKIERYLAYYVIKNYKLKRELTPEKARELLKEEMPSEVINATPLQEYLICKAILPIISTSLSDAIMKTDNIVKPFAEVYKYEDGKSLTIKALRGTLELVDGHSLNEMYNYISNYTTDSIEVCCYGYVSSVRKFNYYNDKLKMNKMGIELILDFDKYQIKTVCWPSKTDFAPKIADLIKEKTPYLFKVKLRNTETWIFNIAGIDEIREKK